MALGPKESAVAKPFFGLNLNYTREITLALAWIFNLLIIIKLADILGNIMLRSCDKTHISRFNEKPVASLVTDVQGWIP